MAVVALVLFGCQEEFEPGGTAVQDAAGTWMISFDGDGPYEAYTFNTSANSDKELWLSDFGHYWDFKVKVPINMSALTFGSTDTLINVVDEYEIKIVVTEGKILKAAATPPSGLPVDSISFKIWFADQTDYGFSNDPISVGGYRYTGWPEDE